MQNNQEKKTSSTCLQQDNFSSEAKDSSFSAELDEVCFSLNESADNQDVLCASDDRCNALNEIKSLSQFTNKANIHISIAAMLKL